MIRSVLLAVLFCSCSRDTPDLPDTVLVDLTITQTNTPATGTRNQPIISSVKMTAPDLCYRFSLFQVVQENPLVYTINAKGTYPRQPTGCPAAVYNKDTLLSIPTSLAGKYVLRFYNGTSLFKSDTVTVN